MVAFLPQFPELTPAMRSVLERMARSKHVPLYTLSPFEARTAYEASADVLEVPKPELARVQDLQVPARDGTRIRTRIYAPTAGPLPVLVYFHGGGFTIGSIATHDILCRTLAKLAGCAVVSVGYRLAPEHRFPTALHDAWDALESIARSGAVLGLDTRRLAVGGDSAGGTLATVCATLARDAGIPIALQLLFYPGCAAWPRAPSHARYHQGLVLEQAHIEYFFRQYVDDHQREDWRFAPLETPDVEGVAPAWFGLAECDPLVDDALAYADKLRAAGVPVDLEIYRGVTHEFIKMGRALPEARQAHADAALSLKKALFAP
ncbi:alpha/beta hydrolase fold domain-containing protein [Ramlibacter sp. XY19]|uniref:alpha/beta hydrolase n=1 Tax=Ramlibacter paludis TaxID=2908000 RepID=UPI0023DCD9AC|nr:alpha/beta hydrolase fold domain-containing protein [Ramlibacter paludis]MCG2593578.1 alpha/beta hydrolase fold domain-containing protein [Ramlibacter paludis]